MKLSGWGRYPQIDSEVFSPQTYESVLSRLCSGNKTPKIARGMGRSYGDSALAAHSIHTRYLDGFLHFDEESGLLTCAAGATLGEILKVFAPKGWFLPVVPGTKFVSVGGAIASDIHGKGHTIDGCFSQYVRSIKLATVSKGILNCSTQDNTDLFRATCGGMGLTGVILEATIQLRKVGSSLIRQETYKTKNLSETISLLDRKHAAAYSAAWIDCVSTGERMGRSVIYLGDHKEEGGFVGNENLKLSVPFDMPGFLLNRFSVGAFNAVYYHKASSKTLHQDVSFESFFFPLDSVLNWNRIYGRKGFTQYQLVIPKTAGLEAMSDILQRITASQKASFLAVFKAFGAANENYLSFPMEGYTLSLDFKISSDLFKFLDELDHIVADYGGRVYLTKDVRLTENMFKRMYPNWQMVSDIRAQVGANDVIHSLQSQRLGLL